MTIRKILLLDVFQTPLITLYVSPDEIAKDHVVIEGQDNRMRLVSTKSLLIFATELIKCAEDVEEQGRVETGATNE